MHFFFCQLEHSIQTHEQARCEAALRDSAHLLPGYVLRCIIAIIHFSQACDKLCLPEPI